MKSKVISRVLVIATLVSIAVPASAQVVQDGNKTGYPLFGTFHGSDLDNVSLTNGNLHVELPLHHVAQRGKKQYSVSYVYDTPGWMILYYPPVTQGQLGQWAVNPMLNTDNSQGWRYVSSIDGGHVDYEVVTDMCPGTPNPITTQVYQNYAWVDAHGTRHQFALRKQSPVDCHGQTLSGSALDGSGVFLDISANKFYLKDGSQPNEDTNGNIPDTLARAGGDSKTSYVDANGTTQTYQIVYQSFPSTPTNLCSFRRNTGEPCTETGNGGNYVNKLILPNGQFYKFDWQLDGTTDGIPDLIKITLPTGGTISYTYTSMKFYGRFDSRTSPVMVRRVVTSRTVTSGGVSNTWTYDGYGISSPTVTINYPTQIGGKEIHTYGYVGNAEGSYEQQVQYLSSTGASLKTVNKSYASESDLGGFHGNNVRLTEEKTTVDGNQTSAMQTDYETFTEVTGTGSGGTANYTGTRLNPSETREYDFGISGSGSAGSMLRKTDYTYLHQTNPPYLAINMVDRVLTQTIYDGNGVQAAQTQYEYDNYTSDTRHASLVTTNAVGHDSAYNGNVLTTRGNVTAITKWLKGGTNPVTYMQYDDAGNVVKTFDPGGHTTSFSFADRWSNSGCSVGTSTFAFPTSITDALGHQVQKTYEPCTGLIKGVKDQNDINSGRAGTTYTYDMMSRPLCTNYADLGQTCLQYNGDPVPPHITKTVIANPNPSITSDFFYEGLGLLTRSQLTSDPLGADITDVTYDAFGHVLTVSNPYRTATDGTICNGKWNNGVCSSGYDAIGRLTGVTKQDGSMVSTQFSGNAGTITDEVGNQKRIYNDALGRVVEVDEPATQSSGYVDIAGTEQVLTIPGTSGTPATATVQIGGSERSLYVCVPAARGRCDLNQSYTTYDYGIVSVTANGFTKQVNYGSSSNSSTIASALASQFNSDGSSPVTASAPGSTLYLTTKLLAQAANNYTLSAQATTSAPNSFPGGSFSASASSFANGSDGTPTQTIYDTGTVQIAVNGESHSVNYDQNSTPPSIASALANAFAGNAYFTASPSGPRVWFTSKVAGASGNYSLSAPSPVTTKPSYFAGASFSSAASGSNLGTGLSNSPYVTQYQYDSLDNLTCAVQKGVDTAALSTCASAPAAWRPRSFSYDSLSRLISSNNPESGSVTYSYAADTNCNPVGEELRTKTDARGLVTTYCYDAEHRVTQKTFSNSTPALSFSYDLAPSWMPDATNVVDRLVEANNQYAGTSGSTAAATVNSYDPMGRVIRQWQQTPSTSPGGYFVYPAYDLAGDLKSLTYPSGRVINYQFDAAAHLYKTYSMASGEYDYLNVTLFWPTGAWQNATYGNGTKQQDTYNPRLQPSELKLLNNVNTAIADRQYLWTGCGATAGNGNNGNVCGINDLLNSTRNQSYYYDALNRIVSGAESDGAFNQAMPYDLWGNASIGGPGAGGRSFNTKNQDTAYGYDAAGNLTNDGTFTYIYDAEERISSLTSNSNSAQVANYVYHADGNRVRKNAGSGWTEYIYFGSDVIAENSPSGWTDYIFAGSKRIAQVSASGTQYYWGDHLGTTKMTLDAFGNSQCYAIYTPFGSEVSGCPTHYKFTGKERDTESGLDYFGARYMASTMGRFMSADPLTVTPGRVVDPQQLNLYAYVRNNPLKHIDPTGMLIDDAACKQDMKHCGKDWQKVQDIANQQDKNGNYLHPELHNELTTLQNDSRTFTIENSSLGAGTAGQFTITNFTADGKDFTKATLQLDFKQIKGISGLTGADLVPGFNKYQGLLDSPMYRLAETFGHEAGHGLFSIQNPGQAVGIQQLLNQRDSAMQGQHYPYPPDVMQKMQQADQALIPTERFAQQVEKIVNGELSADKKKQ